MKHAIYYPTWSSQWVSKASDMDLSYLDVVYPSLTCVYLAFALPDMNYKKGQNSFEGTGLQFSLDFYVVKEAIQILRSRGVCVMLSVGGASYWGFKRNLNHNDILNLVLDLNIDGVDLDYEIPGDGKDLTSAISLISPLLRNNGKYLSAALFSTGAYKSDGQWSGMALDALSSTGHLLDAVNLMSYDAGPPSDFDPIEAFKSYKSVYNGDILMGFEIGFPGWGGYILKESDVERNYGYVVKNGKSSDGAFIWAHKSSGSPDASKVFSIMKRLADSNVNPPLDKPPIVIDIGDPLSIKCPVCSTSFYQK